MQASSKIAIGVGVVAVVGAGLYFFGRKLLDAIGNFNKGTSYEGAGVVGALGNATNQVLGGVPEQVGSSIGLGLYDLFHPSEDEGPDTYYTVIFPDGAKHAIHATDISADGIFQYGADKTIYQIRDKNDNGVTRHYATVF